MPQRTICILLLILMLPLLAVAEESAYYTPEQLEALQVMGIPVSAAERAHTWYEVGSGTNSQYAALLNAQQRVDMGDYHNVYTYSIYECSTCRSRQTMPKVRAEQHLYAVLACEKKKDAQDAYNVTYRCELCGHVRIDILYLADLAEAEGNEAVTCLHGGACPMAGGVWLTNGSAEAVGYSVSAWSKTRVHMDDGTEVIARRLDCWTCRRPFMQIVRDADASAAEYADLPVMTYAEFMSPGERTDLPYQLIDQLREQGE